MSFGIIYKVTNTINDKIYIGQTIDNLKSRIRKHHNSSKLCKDNYHFHNAIRKYGIDNFKWRVIDIADSKDILDELEFHYIKQYDTFRNGYNSTYGGEGVIGHKMTLESKLKMSQSAKNRKGGGMTGKSHSEESRYRMSISAKNRPYRVHSKEHGLAISKAKIGHKVSIETRLKISETLKKRNSEKRLSN